MRAKLVFTENNLKLCKKMRMKEKMYNNPPGGGMCT